MFPRNCLSRGCNLLFQQTSKTPRWMATTTAASPQINPFKFEASEASGIKIAARDDGAPTTSLALVVRGGSRYESLPGLAHALSQFTWKNTERRSALRLHREVELLGGRIGTTISRENIVLRAQFLRQDLPFFIEAIGDVITSTRYQYHIFREEVVPAIKHELDVLEKSAAAKALENAHSVAFHKGLGYSKYATSVKYVDPDRIAEYANTVYNKGNVALVATGASHSELAKWTSEFLKNVKSGSALPTSPTTYYGGESREFSNAGSAYVIAFPGSPNTPFRAEYKVLAHLLGGESAVKWNAGFSLLSRATSSMTATSVVANHLHFTDAGLLYISVIGPDRFLSPAGNAVVKAIKETATIDAEEVKKAIAQAKFDIFSQIEERSGSLELVGQSLISTGKAPQVEGIAKAIDAVTVDSVRNAAKSILSGKATFAAVGDTGVLPFVEDIGLKV